VPKRSDPIGDSPTKVSDPFSGSPTTYSDHFRDSPLNLGTALGTISGSHGLDVARHWLTSLRIKISNLQVPSTTNWQLAGEQSPTELSDHASDLLPKRSEHVRESPLNLGTTLGSQRLNLGSNWPTSGQLAHRTKLENVQVRSITNWQLGGEPP